MCGVCGVCVHACTYCVCVCMCACVYVHVRACVYVCVHVCMCVRTYACVRVCVCACACMCVHGCMGACDQCNQCVNNRRAYLLVNHIIHCLLCVQEMIKNTPTTIKGAVLDNLWRAERMVVFILRHGNDLLAVDNLSGVEVCYNVHTHHPLPSTLLPSTSWTPRPSLSHFLDPAHPPSSPSWAPPLSPMSPAYFPSLL